MWKSENEENMWLWIKCTQESSRGVYVGVTCKMSPESESLFRGTMIQRGKHSLRISEYDQKSGILLKYSYLDKTCIIFSHFDCLAEKCRVRELIRWWVVKSLSVLFQKKKFDFFIFSFPSSKSFCLPFFPFSFAIDFPILKVWTLLVAALNTHLLFV